MNTSSNYYQLGLVEFFNIIESDTTNWLWKGRDEWKSFVRSNASEMPDESIFTDCWFSKALDIAFSEIGKKLPPCFELKQNGWLSYINPTDDVQDFDLALSMALTAQWESEQAGLADKIVAVLTN